MKYLDFVDPAYKPKETDLICTFYLEPEGISLKEAAGGVAAESSVGTWTELSTEKPYVARLAAHVYSFEGNVAKIAYPIELFEPANMPNILSSVAGNVFGLKALSIFAKSVFKFAPLFRFSHQKSRHFRREHIV